MYHHQFDPVIQARSMTPTGDGLMPSYLTLNTLVHDYNGVTNRGIGINGDYSAMNRLESNPLESNPIEELAKLGNYGIGVPDKYASAFGKVSGIKYGR